MRGKYALVDADIRSLGLSLTGLALKRFLRLPRFSGMTSPTQPNLKKVYVSAFLNLDRWEPASPPAFLLIESVK